MKALDVLDFIDVLCLFNEIFKSVIDILLLFMTNIDYS